MVFKTKKKSRTIRIGAIILIVYVVVAVITTLKLQKTNAQHELQDFQRSLDVHRDGLQDLIHRGFVESSSLRSIVDELKESGQLSREVINKVLKSNVLNNRDFLGLWMVWEPDAFDGQDRQYIDVPGSNEEGRFVPYWHWQGDSVIVENCLLFDEEDYYQLPKKNLKSYLLEPYKYPVAGSDSLLISVVLPILNKGEFQGVVGADLSLRSITNIVNRLSQAEGGKSYLVSDNGTIIVHPDQNLIGKLSDFKFSKNGLHEGDYFERDRLTLVSTLNHSSYTESWYMILEIPESAVQNEFASIRFNLLLLAGISAFTIFLLVGYGASRHKENERERQRVEDELYQAGARLTSHIEGFNPPSIYSLDKNLRYTGFNTIHHREMKEVFGHEPRIGAYMPKMIPQEIYDRSMRNFQRVLNGEQFNVTSLFQEQFYSQNFNPVYNQNKEVVGFTSRVHEVTDRVKAEMELERYRDQLEELVEERTIELTRQKEFVQAVIDQIPALIFVRNDQGEYILVNQVMARSFEMTTDEVKGKTIFQTHKDQQEAHEFLEEDKEILATGKSVSGDFLVSMPEGKRWLFLTKSRMMVNDEPHILGVHVDVTHIKGVQLKLANANDELMVAMEKLKSTQLRLIESEKMASIGQLTAGLAHEINNPINYVAGNVGVIRRNIQDVKAMIIDHSADGKKMIEAGFMDLCIEMENLLDGVKEGTDRVVGLIKDLSTFSGPGASISNGVVRVSECIESTVNLVKHQAGKKIVFKLQLEKTPPFEGNPQHLKQVLLNMLTNSFQAIDDNGEIIVRSFKSESNIHIEISDTGTGISKKIINRIFEPFFTTKEVGEGTGLGLAISYNLIKDMGGFIDVDSKTRKGTTFKITLPLRSLD
ncbi:MAG: ATP-binding protein [Cyclobacteriaceae bacterium]